MKKMQKTYQTINFPPLTEEQKKELQALEEMPDEDIDYSDIPEQNGEGQGRISETPESGDPVGAAQWMPDKSVGMKR